MSVKQKREEQAKVRAVKESMLLVVKGASQLS